jgi:hypothetical protein
LAIRFRNFVRIEEVEHTEPSEAAHIEQEVEHTVQLAERRKLVEQLAGRRRLTEVLAGRRRLVGQVVGLSAGRRWSWRELEFSGPAGSRRTVRLFVGGRGLL